MHSACGRFFYCRPDGTLPVGNELFVALGGPPFGLLVAPAQLMEKTTDMIAMVANFEPLIHEIGYSLCGPQLGAISVGGGSLQQVPYKSLFLFSGQSARTARSWLWFQTFRPVSRQCGTPSHYATGMAADATTNFMKRQILLKQGNGFPSPSLQCFRRSVWSHCDTLLSGCRSILHYLCRCQ